MSFLQQKLSDESCYSQQASLSLCDDIRLFENKIVVTTKWPPAIRSASTRTDDRIVAVSSITSKEPAWVSDLVKPFIAAGLEL